MITHVAEAAEARGRVVLRLTPAAGSGRATLAAIDAAVRLAQAYKAEIESLYIEDIELLRLASFTFAAEIPAAGSRLGGARRALSVAGIERDMRLQFSGLQRLVEQRATAADVTVRLRIIRDEPVAAVAATCAACGPWNVVVLTEPLATLDVDHMAALFAAVPDATGLMVVGDRCLPATSNQRPVVLALEHIDALSAMLHTAERLVEGNDTGIVLLLVDDDGAGCAPDMGHDIGQLEPQVRLALAERPPLMRADGTAVSIQLTSLGQTHGEAAVIAEALRRIDPGFLIARFGGMIVPPSCSLRLLGSVLACPLLLIR